MLATAATADAQPKELVMGTVSPPRHGTSQASQQFIIMGGILIGWFTPTEAAPLSYRELA